MKKRSADDVREFLSKHVFLRRWGVYSKDILVDKYLILGGVRWVIRMYFPEFTPEEGAEIAREWVAKERAAFLKRNKIK